VQARLLDHRDSGYDLRRNAEHARERSTMSRRQAVGTTGPD
jgi:hypothetical protein